MMYSLSVFSYGLPRAMEILADCIWRPGLTEQEVSVVATDAAHPPAWCFTKAAVRCFAAVYMYTGVNVFTD